MFETRFHVDQGDVGLLVRRRTVVTGGRRLVVGRGRFTGGGGQRGAALRAEPCVVGVLAPALRAIGPGQPSTAVDAPGDDRNGKGGAALQADIRRDGIYVLRLQPELLRGGRYTIVQRTLASLPFPVEGLTAREREVLGLMAEGRSNAAIAEALVVTERAVEKHVTSIFSKLDLPPTVEDHRRVLAVLAYLRAA